MANWGFLFLDILFMIAKRIEDVQEFVNFRSVCSTWRAATRHEGATVSLQPLRWLMFQWREDPTIRDIYSFTRDKIRKVHFPDEVAENTLILTNGWIVNVSPWREMSLLHPFSHHVIPLPSIAAFKEFYVDKAVLSISPLLSPKDCALMIIHSGTHRLGVWKPGDKSWTLIETLNAPLQDIIYYRDHFYAIDEQGVIYVCDVGGCNPTFVMPIGGIPIEPKVTGLYLVGTIAKHDSLLIVTRYYMNLDNQTCLYKVYEIDLCGKGGVEELIDLGNRTIFVSNDDSVCVEDSKFPAGIVDDDCSEFHCSESYLCPYGCSVSKHPHKRGMFMPIYNLKDKKVENFFYSLVS